MSLKILKNDVCASPLSQTRSIEDYLQSIVNLSSQIMEIIDIPLSDFSDIETRFEQSSTFEEVLLIIEHMGTLSLDQLRRTAAADSKRPKKEKPKPAADLSSISGLASNSYEELEKLLQKYEAEIREHIKIEQQMKIYSDNLEERVGELEAARAADTVRARALEKELQRARAELDALQTDKPGQAQKLHLSNTRGLAISVPKHRKTQSIDTAAAHGHNTQLDLLATNPGDSKAETKKNGLHCSRGVGSQKMKRGFNFQGKAMFSNLKNFYEDFLNNGLKIGNKGSCNSRSENESIRLPLKTLEKGKDNQRALRKQG